MGPSAETVREHVGKRLRRRRRLLGLTQQELAAQAGIAFQQVQKYECAAIRITPERLYQLAGLLSVPVAYFFDGLADGPAAPAAANDAVPEDLLDRREARDLLAAFADLSPRSRRLLVQLAKEMAQPHAAQPGSPRRDQS